jgi:predicted dithiol-disulfide oxidoreductase (DUF899 family)
MTKHSTGTRKDWVAARVELLKAEKEHTRRGDELARRRQELPWVRIEKAYRFETDEGSASLADLFRGRSQLLIYHFMFGPEYTGGCPACSAIADGFNGFAAHLEHHDVAMIAVSRALIAALQAYKRRMGWTFTWASSLDSDFNYDFNTSFTEEQQRSGSIDYNYSALGTTPGSDADSEGRQDRDRAGLDSGEFAAMTGTDLPTYTREAPGMSAFALRRRRLPHLLRLRARPRRALGNVPVARPGAEGAQRDWAVAAAARRVHGRLVSP